MADIDNIVINIEANTSKAESGMVKLASRMDKVREAASDASDRLESLDASTEKVGNGMAEAAEKTMTFSERLHTVVGDLDKFSTALRSSEDSTAFAKNASKVDILRLKLEGAKASLDRLLNTDGGDMTSIANATERVQNLESQLHSLEAEEARASAEIAPDTTRVVAAQSNVRSLSDRLREAASAAKQFSANLAGALGGGLIGGLSAAKQGVDNFFGSIARVAKYRAIRTALKAITQGFRDGMKNLYAWSRAGGDLGTFAASMDRISTSTNYLKNSLGAMVSPLVNALAPALDFLIDKIVEAINWLNQLFAALSGADTYTVAKKSASAWQSAAKSAGDTAKELKRTILGFDEINKLVDNSGGGGGGDGGGSSGGVGSFEQKELSGAWQGFSNAFETALSDQMSRIGLIIAGAELALGGILLLSGAAPGIGLALMASGAALGVTEIVANWEGISDDIKVTIGAIEAALAGGLAVGAILAFSGGHIPLGIGLMIGALSMGYAGVSISWTTLSDKVGGAVNAVAAIVGGALVGIGAVLAFSGTSIPIGLGMIAAGVSIASTAINWDTLKEKVQNPLSEIAFIVGAASLAIGAILALSHVSVPVGLALMLTGAASIVAAATVNWDYLKEKIKGPVGEIVAVVSQALLMLGVIALCSGHVPLGAGLIIAGAAGLAATASVNFDAIKEKLQGPIGVIEGIIGGSLLLLGILAIVAGNVPLGLGLIVAGAAALAAPIAANWDKLVQFGKDCWTKLQEGWDSVKDKALEIGAKIATTAQELWDGVKDAWGKFTDWVVSIGAKIGTTAKELWNAVKDKWAEFTGWVVSIGAKIGTSAKELWNGVKEKWSEFTGWVVSIGAKIGTTAQSLWDGVKDTWNKFTGWVVSIGAKIGTTAQNLWDGVKDTWSKFTGWVVSVGAKIGTTAQSLWDGVKDTWGKFTGWVVEVGAKIKTTAQNLWDGLSTGWGLVQDKVVEIGAKLGITPQSLWDGLKSGWELVQNKSLEVAAAVKDGAQGLWDKISTGWSAIQDKSLEIAGKLHLVEWAEKVVNWFMNPTFDLKIDWDSIIPGWVKDIINTINGWTGNGGSTDTTDSSSNNGGLSGIGRNVAASAAAANNSVNVPIEFVPQNGAPDIAADFQGNWNSLAKDQKQALLNNQLQNTPKNLTSDFGTKWNQLSDNDKAVALKNIMQYQPNKFAANYIGDWGKLSDADKSIYLNNKYNETASNLASKFGGDWDKLSDAQKTIMIINTMANTPTNLSDDFKKKWVSPSVNVLTNLAKGNFKDGVQSWFNGLTGIIKSVDLVANLTRDGGNFRPGVGPINWFKNLPNTNKEAWLTANLDVGDKSNIKDGTGKWFGGLTDVDKNVDLTANLNRSGGNFDSTKSGVGGWFKTTFSDKQRGVNVISNLTTAGSNWKGKNGLAKWFGDNGGSDPVGVKTDLTKNNWKNGLLTFLTGNASGIVDIALKLGGSAWGLVKGALHAFGVPGFALGGAINANGDIQRFAGGGSVGGTHGTLFLAGEAGAEIVGNIGGRTEVLNKSQIAAAIYGAVRTAMTGIHIDATINQTDAENAEDLAMLMDLVRAGSEATMRQNELLREQNDYLRQINAKEFRAEVSTAQIARAQTYVNLRAGTTIIPVGT